MQTYKNVECTKPFELLFLLVSTIAIFIGTIIILNKIISFKLLKVMIAIIFAGIYFYKLKKKFIVKVSDFKLTSNKLEWNNKSINFKDLAYYKIHWMKGAGIKFKFKNGKTIQLSSNDNFCNSKKFVILCDNIDSKLLKYNNGQILRKKSFLETKLGYYYAVIITVLFLIITIYKFITDERINSENYLLILVLLGIIWSGVRWKRK